MSRSRLALLLILAAGLGLRLGALNDPVTYDEAYTYVGFASRSLWAIVSDYSLPNNHILHSLLAHFSTQILGNQPWTLRLPALLAGLGVIWMVYLLGKELYSRTTGLAAAALAAGLPELIRFSTDARGYSLLGLFTLLVFWLGLRLTRQPTHRDWILLSIFTALGFWTIPLMLYPTGGLYLWLFLELSLRGGLRRSNPLSPGDRFAPGRLAVTISWLLSGLGAGALTLLLYTPVLVISGWRKLLANGFVQPVEVKEYFDWILWTQIRDTAQGWIKDVPLLLVGLLILGFLLSLAFHRRIQATRWPLPLVLLAWIAFLVVARRPEAFDRFWSWLIAPVLLWSTAGIVETVFLLGASKNEPQRSPRTQRETFKLGVLGALGGSIKYGEKETAVGWRKFPFPAILTGAALVWLLASLAVAVPTFPEKWAKVGNPQAAALYLKENLQPGEVVLVGYPNNAPVWYYLALYGVPATAWQADGAFTRAYVLVAANQERQTLASVVKSYGLDPARLALGRAEGLARYGQILIYRCETK